MTASNLSSDRHPVAPESQLQQDFDPAAPTVATCARRQDCTNGRLPAQLSKTARYTFTSVSEERQGGSIKRHTEQQNDSNAILELAYIYIYMCVCM